MKRYIHSSIPTLHVVIELSEETRPIAASVEFKEMTHPSVSKKYRQSDEWVRNVNDLARSIYNSMIARKFDVFKSQASKKSYTYYLGFRPADKEGNLWDQELGLQIELRDHVSKTHEDSGQVTEKFIVRTFYLEGQLYSDMFKLLQQIWLILDDVQRGDFSSFAG